MGTRIIFSICVSALVLAAGMSGCAGQNAEPKAPEPEPQSAPVEAAALEVEPEPVLEESAAVDAEPASENDVKAALQVVLDDEALRTALNFTEPGRFPLKISGASLPSGLELQVGDKPVEIVPKPENAKETPVLVFTDIDMNKENGSLKYRYDIDGVRGTSYVIFANGRWELKSSRVSGY